MSPRPGTVRRSSSCWRHRRCTPTSAGSGRSGMPCLPEGVGTPMVWPFAGCRAGGLHSLVVVGPQRSAEFESSGPLVRSAAAATADDALGVDASVTVHDVSGSAGVSSLRALSPFRGGIDAPNHGDGAEDVVVDEPVDASFPGYPAADLGGPEPAGAELVRRLCGTTERCTNTATLGNSRAPQDGYPCHGQRVDRVQDPGVSTEIILANSTVTRWAGIGFGCSSPPGKR